MKSSVAGVTMFLEGMFDVSEFGVGRIDCIRMVRELYHLSADRTAPRTRAMGVLTSPDMHTVFVEMGFGSLLLVERFIRETPHTEPIFLELSCFDDGQELRDHDVTRIICFRLDESQVGMVSLKLVKKIVAVVSGDFGDVGVIAISTGGCIWVEAKTVQRGLILLRPRSIKKLSEILNKTSDNILQMSKEKEKYPRGNGTIDEQ